ncbi:hypothetical protein ACKWTF_008713 [Chironomus riparius]
MWIIKTTLSVILIVGLCTAADTTSSKSKTVVKEKEAKEKRDAGSATSGPYSYVAPQKQFHSPIHVAQPQAKYANNEHQQTIQKVAPLEYTKQEVAPVQVQHVQHVEQPAQQFHPTTFHHQASAHYAPEAENSLAQAYKAYDDFAFSYPSYESFSQMPIVHYNGDYDKISSSVISIPGYSLKSAPMYSNIKSVPSYSYAAPYTSQPSTASYVVPSSYSYPSYTSNHQSAQQAQHSYPSAQHSYPSAQHSSYPSAPYSYANIYAPANSHSAGYTSQIPAAVYVSQPIVHKPVQTKAPIYATGSKGLSHYSSANAAPIAVHQSNAYVKNTYEVPQYTQTERPFKPSAFLGASHISGGDSYTEQSISSGKPLNTAEYYVPSKSYLPAKETVQYVSYPVKENVQYSSYPVKENVQYSSYPVKENVQYSSYPVKENVQYSSYPVKENVQYSSQPAKQTVQYSSHANKEVAQYASHPGKETYQYVAQPQIEYQIQYVQQPAKSYLPPVANSYLPPKSAVPEAPKNSYLPPTTAYPQAPSKNYLPAKVEKPVSTYLPPTKTYLPPSASYQNQQYQHHQAPSAPSQSNTEVHQQYQQSHENYDSSEYQAVVSQSGHK